MELPDDCAVSGLKKVLPGMDLHHRAGLDMVALSTDYTLMKDDTLIKPGMDISIFPPVVGG